jgi:hypothetical protein
MSLFSTISSFFTKSETVVTAAVADIEAGFKTADNLAGVVLGQAGIVGAGVMLVDPALGAEIEAGVAAITALKATLEAGFAAAEPAVATMGAQVMQLLAMVGTLGVQVAPFYTVVATEASAVSTAAVAVVKALPTIPATV